MGLHIPGLTGTISSPFPHFLYVPLANIGLLCFVLCVMQLASINEGNRSQNHGAIPLLVMKWRSNSPRYTQRNNTINFRILS